MRLAAAKCGLQLDDRLPALAGDTLHSLHQEPRHALRHIGTSEELDGIAVLIGSFAAGNLSKIRREFSGTITAFSHIRVRLHNRSPTGKVLTNRDL